MTDRKLLLVDASSYLYRAFHALPPLTNSKGEPTGAVLGVLNMLNKLMKDEAPSRVAIVFDAPGRTFRDDLFDQYKAHRVPMPDDLRPQIQPLLEAVEALGLPLLRISGVEADDVIGTLAMQAAACDYDVLISTGDKDMAQLVGPRISLINTMSNVRLDRIGVKTKFDVFPEQIVDYLALVGDSSDNISGVTGVGAKTAAKWLNLHQNLDALISSAAQLTGKVGENLRAELPALELSRKLATIDTAVPLTVKVDDLSAGLPDIAKLRALYTRLELRLLLRSLEPTPAESPSNVASSPTVSLPPASSLPGSAPPESVLGVVLHRRDYEKVVTAEAFDAWLAKLNAASLFSFSTTTDSDNYFRARIVGVSFAISSGEAAYVPLSHDYPGAPQQLGRDTVLTALKPLLEDSTKPKLGHHLKIDTHILANHGIELAGQRYDSMLESYVLNSVVTQHDRDSIVRKYLGVEAISYENICGKGVKRISFNQVDVEHATEYAAQGADVTLQLHQALWPKLDGLPGLKSIYETIEQPLAPVLYRMERTGVLIDRELLKIQSIELSKRMFELQGQAHIEAGRVFNLDSPKQLQDVLFGKLGLPVIRKDADRPTFHGRGCARRVSGHPCVAKTHSRVPGYR